MLRLGFSVSFAALLLAACSDFFGDGPDPSRAGPFTSGGSGGGGGSTGACDAVSVVLGTNDPGCEEVSACVYDSCGSAVSYCLGRDPRMHDFGGGRCPSYMTCIEGCGCDAECLAGCEPDSDSICFECLSQLFACAQASCLESRASCESGNFPVPLIVNLQANVNDIAVDDTHVYFVSTQGLAKVAKAGGNPTPLGGFSSINGLAVAGDFIYLVQDNGALTRLAKDGGNLEIISPATQGGGSGPILLDADYAFYAVGPSLRRAPLGGGIATELSDEFYFRGLQMPTHLALGATSVYYMASDPGQNYPTYLQTIEKTAAPGSGTRLASGSIHGIVADAGKVYYADESSDGVTTTLRVSALDPETEQITQLAINTPLPGYGGAPDDRALAVNGGRLYFGGLPGLFSVNISDKTVETIAFAARPSVLEVDDEYVYYSEQIGNVSIWRVKKPEN